MYCLLNTNSTDGFRVKRPSSAIIVRERVVLIELAHRKRRDVIGWHLDQSLGCVRSIGTSNFSAKV